MKNTIDWDKVEFKGDKRYLSNMYVSQIKMLKEYKKIFPLFEMYFDDYIYNSSEHIYQLLKFDSLEWISLIKGTDQPQKTKTLSRDYLKTDNVVRGNWDIYLKDNAMRIALFLKFSQNKELLKELQDAKGPLEEKNDWEDKYWGTYNGKGLNILGEMLMTIRDKGLNTLLEEETKSEILIMNYNRVEEKYRLLRKMHEDKGGFLLSDYYDSKLSLFWCLPGEDNLLELKELEKIEKNLDDDIKELKE